MLNGEESVKFAFYSKAKELLGGTYDNFDSYEVEYFKYLGSSQKIMPVPLLFKHMDDNFIYLKGLKVTMEQAMAIKEILNDPEKYGFHLDPKDMYSAVPTFKVEVSEPVLSFADFANKYEINYKILKSHNPWLREPHLANQSKKVYSIQCYNWILYLWPEMKLNQ